MGLETMLDKLQLIEYKLLEKWVQLSTHRTFYIVVCIYIQFVNTLLHLISRLTAHLSASGSNTHQNIRRLLTLTFRERTPASGPTTPSSLLEVWVFFLRRLKASELGPTQMAQGTNWMQHARRSALQLSPTSTAQPRRGSETAINGDPGHLNNSYLSRPFG
jgi:hypothetical protein